MEPTPADILRKCLKETKKKQIIILDSGEEISQYPAKLKRNNNNYLDKFTSNDVTTYKTKSIKI